MHSGILTEAATGNGECSLTDGSSQGSIQPELRRIGHAGNPTQRDSLAASSLQSWLQPEAPVGAGAVGGGGQ